jgi:branched-chain amino acid aminotransferase
MVDIKAAITAVLKANNLSDAVARLTLTRGVAPRGLAPASNLSPTLLITITSWPGSPPPARCVIAKSTRRNEYSPLARVKSLNYLDNILAQQEAMARGANEAILLNTKGCVAETTMSNLFVVKEGQIFTPPIQDGALPGIMRTAVLAAYPSCMEKLLLPEDIYNADGVFLTNSLGIRTLASLDGKPAAHTARAFMEDIRIRLAA